MAFAKSPWLAHRSVLLTRMLKPKGVNESCVELEGELFSSGTHRYKEVPTLMSELIGCKLKCEHSNTLLVGVQ